VFILTVGAPGLFAGIGTLNRRNPACPGSTATAMTRSRHRIRNPEGTSIMTAAATRNLITRYYTAFNAQDTETMLDCLGPGFVHDVSQGERRKGKKRFAEFLAHMHNCYHEQLSDIAVMTSTDGSRAASEFKLKGRYLATDEGLPPAAGQTYRLTVGAFFEIKDGKITRVSTHYSLPEWTRQVVG
jgi:steroid delta-isomerase-like uncharacterized protein